MKTEYKIDLNLNSNKKFTKYHYFLEKVKNYRRKLSQNMIRSFNL